jgi:hypothetical protein
VTTASSADACCRATALTYVSDSAAIFASASASFAARFSVPATAAAASFAARVASCAAMFCTASVLAPLLASRAAPCTASCRRADISALAGLLVAAAARSSSRAALCAASLRFEVSAFIFPLRFVKDSAVQKTFREARFASWACLRAIVSWERAAALPFVHRVALAIAVACALPASTLCAAASFDASNDASAANLRA